MNPPADPFRQPTGEHHQRDGDNRKALNLELLMNRSFKFAAAFLVSTTLLAVVGLAMTGYNNAAGLLGLVLVWSVVASGHMYMGKHAPRYARRG